MITLYGMSSPNVLKITIMLEELEIPYAVVHVRVMSGEGQRPGFLALNPLGKVPVIVDNGPAGTGKPIFESGAILLYLAETYGPSLLPAEGEARWEVLQWLILQVAFAGPMLGQLNHFQLVPGQEGSYADQRYRDQARLVYGNLEKRLSSAAWLGGEEYSIADIAMYPWSPYLERHGFDPATHPHFVEWRRRIDERPAVVRAAARLNELANEPQAPIRDEDWDSFFNRTHPGPRADIAAYVELGPMVTAKS